MEHNHPTKEQRALYEHMVNFAIDTIISFYNVAIYSIKAKTNMDAPTDMLFDLGLTEKIIGPLEHYLNYVAYLISSREDTMINKAFDTMTAIPLQGLNHPQDLLAEIVLLCSYLITNVDPREHLENEYSLRDHMRELLLADYRPASLLLGCSPDHKHVPVKHGERVFTFSKKDADNK